MTANSAPPTIGIVRLAHADDIALPAYATAGSAGMDLRAAVVKDCPVVLLPGQRELVPTGLRLELPEGFEGQVRPRSGLALNHGITCLNTPGTIDSDYRGEIGVILINLGENEFAVTRGMRIAQLVITRFVQAQLKLRVHAGATPRARGGFGSTGYK